MLAPSSSAPMGNRSLASSAQRIFQKGGLWWQNKLPDLSAFLNTCEYSLDCLGTDFGNLGLGHP